MSSAPANVPPDLSTAPDQIAPEASDCLEFIDGERIRFCWSLPDGFLVLTQYRCLAVRHRDQLFRREGWHVASEYYFYNLRPPEIVAGRYLQLSELSYALGGGERFEVQHPEQVAEVVRDAIVVGQALWAQKRQQFQSERADRLTRRGSVRFVPSHPCAYCGTTVPGNDRICPSCGAPQR